MKFPILDEIPRNTESVEIFGGYNHNLRIGNGEFYDMKNLTSDYYPLLSPRKPRQVYKYPEGHPFSPEALAQKDALCYVDNDVLYINEKPISGFLESGEAKERTLVSMGAYLIVFPDKKYINTVNHSDRGPLEASFGGESETKATFEITTLSGENIEAEQKDTEPETPADKAMWIDTSGDSDVMKQWSESMEMWVDVPTSYIKISAPNIAKNFKEYDAVKLEGTGASNNPVLKEYNGKYIVIYGLKHNEASGDVAEGTGDYIITKGVLRKEENLTIKLSRKVPDADFWCESQNRLWGCKYGRDDSGNVVNEIFASALGDFKNFNTFIGTAADSYRASVGTDGVFTGAITHNGYPLFFKENHLHKVYGNYPANYQIQATSCQGVQKGSGKSLAIVNNVLYYKSKSGICVYDGSLPHEISGIFGGEYYSDAVGGGARNKYYVSMKDVSGKWSMFVYSTLTGMWHKEDDTQALGFCSCRGELYFIDASSKRILTVSETNQETPTDERVEWMAESGILAMTIGNKYVSKLLLRASLEVGGSLAIFVQYNSMGDWMPVFATGTLNLKSLEVPIMPQRCDHLRLRFKGKGDCKIFSITKVIEQGSV